MCIYIGVYRYICIHIDLHVYVNTSVCSNVYIYIHIYIYIGTHMYIYIYIHTYIQYIIEGSIHTRISSVPIHNEKENEMRRNGTCKSCCVCKRGRAIHPHSSDDDHRHQHRQQNHHHHHRHHLLLRSHTYQLREVRLTLRLPLLLCEVTPESSEHPGQLLLDGRLCIRAAFVGCLTHGTCVARK